MKALDLFRQADGILRAGMRETGSSAGSPSRTPRLACLPAVVAVFGGLYGATMGTYGAGSGPRLAQALVSAAKAPLLVLGTFALALPTFAVLNALAGLAGDFRQTLRALLTAQGVLALVLASLAPVTVFWYVTVPSYPAAVLWNAVVFAIAALAGQAVLRRCYRPLEAANVRHRLLRRCWLGLYGFVGIQMAWVLRPFIGDPDLPVTFFRPSAWGNAYVHLLMLVWRVLGG